MKVAVIGAGQKSKIIEALSNNSHIEVVSIDEPKSSGLHADKLIIDEAKEITKLATKLFNPPETRRQRRARERKQSLFTQRKQW